MALISVAKLLNCLRAQLLELQGHNFELLRRGSGYFELEEVLGEFSVRILVSSIPGYGHGRVLCISNFFGMNIFPAFKNCTRWPIGEGVFPGPFIHNGDFANRNRYRSNLPYGDEGDLEKNRDGFMSWIDGMLNAVPMVRSLEDVDSILGPIRTSVLSELMQEWVDADLTDCANSRIKNFPGSTLSVYYGPYAFGLWKVALSQYFDRDYEETKSWFQEILRQNPNFEPFKGNNLLFEKFDREHLKMYPNIVKAFQELTHGRA